MSCPKTPEQHGHAKLGDEPAAAERSTMANQQESLEAPKSTALDGKTELFHVLGHPLLVRAVDFAAPTPQAATMNKDDFWVGAIAGAIVGALLIAGVSIYLRDRGRDECNIKLPRTEKCVQVWVPQARSKP